MLLCAFLYCGIGTIKITAEEFDVFEKVVILHAIFTFRLS